MGKIILAIILIVIAIVVFIFSFRSFMEKGYLFNNAYIHASEQERKDLNKKPHYRQTAICLLLIGIIFLIIAAEVIFEKSWLFYLSIAVEVLTVIYAFVSAIAIQKQKK